MENITNYLKKSRSEKADILINHLVEEDFDKAILQPRKSDLNRRLCVFSASALGSSGKSLCGNYTIGCARKLFFRYMGVPPEGKNSAGNIRRLEVGHSVHEITQRYFLEASKDKTSNIYNFKAEVPISPENNKLAKKLEIASTTDGIYEYGDIHQETVLEIKSIGAKAFNTLIKPKPEHLTQAQTYMGLLDIPIANLFYFSLGGYCPVRSFIVEFDPKHWEAIVAKIDFVRTCAKKTEPPTEEPHFFCRGCEYRRFCNVGYDKKRVKARKKFRI